MCWDNAMRESFWSTLKVEFYDRYRWATRAEAKQKVAWWIEDFCNRRRLHSSLGWFLRWSFSSSFVFGRSWKLSSRWLYEVGHVSTGCEESQPFGHGVVNISFALTGHLKTSGTPYRAM